MSFDGYGSHIHVFEKIFEKADISSVLEFGMGLYSTKFFTDHCEFVASIEQESMEWYRQTAEQINSPCWHPRYEADPKVVFDGFDNEGVKFDLVFSDGLAQSRCQVANMAMQRQVRFVVLHDAEKIRYYRWNLLDIPDNYFRYDFCRRNGSGKVTTILTNDCTREIHKWEIPEHERVMHAYLSPQQPIIQVSLKGGINILISDELNAAI